MQGAEPHGMPDVPATLERRVAGRPDQEASSPRALLRRRWRLARAALEILLEQMRERVHVTQRAFTRVRAALVALTRKAPRHEIDLALEERIEVRVRGADQRVARIALRGWDRIPVLHRRIL